jgi:plasmid stabilization system protein ParE
VAPILSSTFHLNRAWTMTTTCLPAPIPLHRSWLRRIADDLAERWRARRAAAELDAVYRELAPLSETLLRDLGAPPWLHSSTGRPPDARFERTGGRWIDARW